LYIQYQLDELGIGTTEIDEGDRLEEDLTAIPDLAGWRSVRPIESEFCLEAHARKMR